MTTVPIRRALLSVHDKTGIVDLARDLAQRGVHLLSTGGTLAILRQAGVAVDEVAQWTGQPEMLDGRVKTLHPRIHGGLLARRDDPGHAADCAAHGIEPIDLVVVNLYPFEATCDDPANDEAACIEQIDIGGPSMLRSAAKNHAHVTVLTDPSGYPALQAELAAHDGGTTLAFRAACARRVFRQTAYYDALIADELTRRAFPDGELPDDERHPPYSALALRRVQHLKYGENPHQSAACYALREPGVAALAQARQVHGAELGYCNIMDADGAWRLVTEFANPACAIIKHANPCGCAVADDLTAAFLAAWAGDPQAAFGSTVACNRCIDADTARVMAEQALIHIVIAPAFSDEALAILTTQPRWKNSVRLLAVGAISPLPATGRSLRGLLGGVLIQDLDRPGWTPQDWQSVGAREPDAREWRDLELAWLVVKHLSSNAIALVKDQALVGPGCGQMSRVNSADLAVRLAGPQRSAGSVLASDAFFPFPDGVESAAAAGVTAIIQPGGSKGDAAVIAAAQAHGLAMVLTGRRHFRH